MGIRRQTDAEGGPDCDLLEVEYRVLPVVGKDCLRTQGVQGLPVAESTIGETLSVSVSPKIVPTTRELPDTQCSLTPEKR